MKIRCSHSAMVPIAELKTKFHPKNRNKHPEDQLARLAKILEYQGARYAAKISKRSGLLTSGHGRILAAELAGWDSYPVDYQDYDSDEQEYADVQADNAIASWSELDLSGINADVVELGPDFDIDLLGIKSFDLDPSEKLEFYPMQISQEFNLLVECSSEVDQQNLFEQFEKQGLRVKIL